MTDTALLESIIKDKGLKKSKITETLDISYRWLKKKINNEVQFKAHEIQALCELLEIDDLELKDRIFFAENVDE